MAQAHITDISHLPLFDGISPSDCTLLFDCLGSRIRKYKKDEHILLERELAGNVGTVIDGSVHIYKEDIWGNRTLLSYVRSGSLFGENLPFKNIESPAEGPFFEGDFSGEDEAEKEGVSFISVTPSLVLFLPVRRILHPCNQSCPFHHRLSQNLFSMIAAKNRRLMDKIDIISRGSVREKILSYLSLEARRQRSSSFQIPLRRTEMAEYLCINRSAMSRELNILKNEGLIDFEKDRFTLLCLKQNNPK